MSAKKTERETAMEQQRAHDHRNDHQGDALLEENYRRGCQQAVAMSLQFAKQHELNPSETVRFLEELESVLGIVRHDGKAYKNLMHWAVNEALWKSGLRPDKAVRPPRGV